LPVELAFILQRLRAMADKDESLRFRQPWKAAYEKDYTWLGNVLTKHYNGDDSDVKVLMGGILRAFSGLSVEAYETWGRAFVGQQHQALNRPYAECGYQPMIELLRYLEANGFTNYIASGGSRDFMRSFAWEVYRIPPERIIGSSTELGYQDRDASVVYKEAPDVFDDGPAKPVRIWSRIGRRPLIAAGNANGDAQMLRFAGGNTPALRLLILHDDAEREYDYVKGAESALAEARAGNWTVISIRDDWRIVFGEQRLALAA
jgi:hypothetical protein